ncbi:MAG: hypothetical protein JXR76_26780 [Deltaproteobacteria bacterium]|nr:hypothetical protein [Deltaproteobacteria bacterium]
MRTDTVDTQFFQRNEALVAITVSLLLTVGNSGCFSADGREPTGAIPQPNAGIMDTVQRRSPPEVKKVPEIERPQPRFPVRQTPESLTVPGFEPAAFVTPSEDTGQARPVIIVLHGNFDRPEWQCEMWQEVGSWHGWILCPRGVRTPFATLAEDRWTYKGGAPAISAEMIAALDALDARFPGAVLRRGLILVGFSLGAIRLPELIRLHPDTFETVFLIEGGLKQLEAGLPMMKKNGVKRIGLAMSTAGNRQNVSVVQNKIKRYGLRSVYVDMKGAGHNYRSDFGRTGNRALHQLLDTVEMTQAAEADK